MSRGRVDEPRPRREGHVICRKEGVFLHGLRPVEVPRQRVAVTEPAEVRPGNPAKDPGRRAEYRPEIGAEMKLCHDGVERPNPVYKKGREFIQEKEEASWGN